MADLLHQSLVTSPRRSDASVREQIICNLEQILYLLIIAPLVAFLPAPLAYGLACLRGDWRYSHDTFTRQLIMRSLEGVLSDQLSPAECARVTRDFFRRRSCQAIDVMRLAGRGRALVRLIEMRGLEHIEAALAAGKGAILCSAHFGLFNGAYSLIGACGFPITVVGDWQSKSDSNMSPVHRIFWRLGFEGRVARRLRRPNIEPQKEGAGIGIRIAEILRSNELVSMAIDIPVPVADRVRAVPVDFLGRQIPLLPGSVLLAQLTGSPVLVLVLRRSADWRHQVLEISPVPLDGDALTAFKRCVAMLEAPIRQDLAHWDAWENPQDLADLGLLSTYSLQKK